VESELGRPRTLVRKDKKRKAAISPGCVGVVSPSLSGFCFFPRRRRRRRRRRGGGSGGGGGGGGGGDIKRKIA